MEKESDKLYYGINGKQTEEAAPMEPPKKVYILDKSVLLSSPYAIFAFDEHTVLVPFNVIQDLDYMKKSANETGRNAQEVLRIIEDLRKKGNLHQGIELENGGTVFVDNSQNETVIESAYNCKRNCPDETNIIIVSNSTAACVRAEEAGFKAEVYRSDSVDTENRYLGRTTVYCYNAEIDTNGIPKEIAIKDLGNEQKQEFTENEFVTVKRANESTLGIFQVKGKKLVRLNMDNLHPYGVKPRNVAQKMAIHALLDTLDSSALTILMGDAGTAKTFLSLACGLEQTVGDDIKYRSILVVRPNVKFDETVGFLKGSEAQKINPLIRPVMDNLDQLTAIKSDNGLEKPESNRKKKKFAEDDDTDKIVAPNSYAQYLFDSGKIEAQAMEYMRGRSIRDRILLIDEAQNMTPLQAFGIISRAGMGTKIVLAGDPNQVDNPLLDSRTNGLTYAANAMKGSKVCTQITFEESECERSELAKEAIKRMKIKGKTDQEVKPRYKG